MAFEVVNACKAAARSTALGLVKMQLDEASASLNRERAFALSIATIRSGDIASNRPLARAVASRSPRCWPCGRREIAYHSRSRRRVVIRQESHTMSETELATRIEGLLHAMPPVAALQPRLATLDDGGCSLQAPLAANINDKGCAFGGSLVSLMTLAGWGLVTAWLERRGIGAEVYVADSQVKYRAPLYDDLDARAQFAGPVMADAVLGELADRHRVSFRVQAEVRRADGRVATSMESRYVAVVPDQTGPG